MVPKGPEKRKLLRNAKKKSDSKGWEGTSGEKDSEERRNVSRWPTGPLGYFLRPWLGSTLARFDGPCHCVRAGVEGGAGKPRKYSEIFGK